MKRNLLLSLLFCVSSITPLAAALPPTGLDVLSPDTTSVDAFKVANHAASLAAALATLNAGGGIPFVVSHEKRYERVICPAGTTNFTFPARKIDEDGMTRSEACLLELAPGKQYIVFSHHFGMYDSATTIWAPGARFATLKLAFGGSLSGIKRTDDGMLLLLFTSQRFLAEVKYDPAHDVWTPACMIRLSDTENGLAFNNEGLQTIKPLRAVRFRAGGLPLYEYADVSTKIVARTPQNQAWAFATGAGWQHVLIPRVAGSEYWTQVFAGKCWSVARVPDASIAP